MMNERFGVVGSATGFLFSFASDGDMDVPCLVTNRHVLSQCANVQLTFTREKEDRTPDVGNTVRAIIPTADAIFHPDSTIDLAVLPIGLAADALAKKGTRAFFIKFSLENIPDDSEWAAYSAIENVIMAGYPKGFRDAVNSLPIFRSGITATHPALNFSGKPQFLVDMPCFEGCSGSPVLICDEGMHIDKRTRSISVGNKVSLLGIQYAIPLNHSIGRLATVPTDAGAQIPVMPLYISLGYIIRSTELLVFESIIRAKLKPKVADTVG